MFSILVMSFALALLVWCSICSHTCASLNWPKTSFVLPALKVSLRMSVRISLEVSGSL